MFEWQRRCLKSFANRPYGRSKHMNVVASNGGGKSSIVLAGCAAWTAMSFKQSQTAITSASVAQLDAQTMRAIARLAGNINAYHGAPLWDIQGRKIVFSPNGSPIDARKSDEEGTQEGFHPIVPGGEFTILVDEAKTLSKGIYDGILKWTGFTRRVDITSAGDPAGPFYEDLMSNRHENWVITADDCPNISQQEKENIIASSGGVDSPKAQQILYSRFVAMSGSVVIPLDILNHCMRLAEQNVIVHDKRDYNSAGLDLSGGGDETVMSVFNGNKQIALEPFRFRDTTMAVEEIIRLTKKYQLPPEHRRADAGGLGKPMLDQLASKGYPWIRIHNQSRPVGRNVLNWGNRGTQMWFDVARLVEDGRVILLKDEKQQTQLANRYYTQQKSTDKIIVEPKAEARAMGHPSPDRADATILALADYKAIEETKEEAKSSKIPQDQLEDWYENVRQQKFTEDFKGAVTISDLLPHQK